MGRDRSSHASPRQHYRPGTARHRGVSKVRKVKAHSSGAHNYCKSSYTSYRSLSMIAHLSKPEYAHVLLNPLPVCGLTVGVLGLVIALLLRADKDNHAFII